MPAYDPRESESRFQPDGTSKNPWDPYTQYMLESEWVNEDGQIYPEKLPPVVFDTGVSPDQQAAIDAAKTEALLAAQNAQATADSADATANTAITQSSNAQAVAQAFAADAAQSAQNAENLAQQALDLGSGTVAQSVEDYLSTVPGLVDSEDGRIVQWRAPRPYGRIYTVPSIILNQGGVSVFRFDSAPGTPCQFPDSVNCLAWADFVLKNASAATVTVAFSSGSDLFDDGSVDIDLAAGEVARVTTSGDGMWYLLSRWAGPAPAEAVPAAPRSLVVAPTDTELHLSWSAPAAYPSVTDYTIQYKVSSDPSYTVVSDGVSTATTYTITGLTAQTEYSVQVLATNSVGTGSPADALVSTLVTQGPPAQVTGLVASTGSVPQSVNLGWGIPTANPAIIDYVIQYKLTADSTFTTYADGTGTATSAEILGLTAGESYDFQVAALNAEGQGPWSATSTATAA
jgi:hypothetical protein